ncbi:MAG: hypothetical protein H6757_06910 [Candidatus Omnitrophica bacterium]|nr:hypothetical protein [Candidatus Omnitrophota bacterium]
MYLLRKWFILIGIWSAVLLEGCVGIPAPAVAVSLPAENLIENSSGNSIDEGFNSWAKTIVLKYVIGCIRDKAGLKIAGVVEDEAFPVHVIALPQKSDGMVVIWIPDLLIISAPNGGITEVKLTLSLAAYDNSGKVIYKKAVSSHDVREPPARISDDLLESFLEYLTKDTLKQYLHDPALQTIILKFKYPGISNLF